MKVASNVAMHVMFLGGISLSISLSTTRCQSFSHKRTMYSFTTCPQHRFFTFVTVMYERTHAYASRKSTRRSGQIR